MADKEPNTYGKPLASGETLWSWQPTSRDTKNKCPMAYTALGTDFAQAMVKAQDLNATLYQWRKDRRANRDEVSHAKGTFGWLLTEFEKYGLVDASDKYKDEVARYVRIAGELKLKGGKAFIHQDLEKVTVKAAQNCVIKIKETRGGSTAKKARAIFSAAWAEGFRLNEAIVPETNPWSHVKLSHKEQETFAASYDQLQSYVSAAIAMGEIGMAVAARLCWDMHIRPTEVFRSVMWSSYRPGHKPHHFLAGHEKRDTGGWQPMDDPEDLKEGRVTPLFTELEDLLRMMPQKGALICMREERQGTKIIPGSWLPIKNSSTISRRIRAKAGLPDEVTLKSFRHGGITELGESGAETSLIQARTAHRQRASLDRYDHTNDRKSASAQKLRLAHRREG